MKYLKQSTASQSVLLGPFVDDTDGTAAEISLTILNTDIRLSKAGGNMAAKNSGGGTHDELGYYTITLDATDTNTVGILQVVCKMAGALVVEDTFHVLEEAVYDDMFAASAAGYAGITELAAIPTTPMRGTDNAATETKQDIIDGLIDVLNLGIITGVCQTGTLSVTACTTDLTGYLDDQLIRGVIIFTSGAAEGERAQITDYAQTNGLVTYATIQQAPANGDTFKIV